MSRLPSALVLAALCALCLLAVVDAQLAYYQMCFTSSQTNVNSPGLAWAVSDSAVLTFNTSAAAMTSGQNSFYTTGTVGYLVMAATGTRVIYQANKAAQTLSITGVAAPGSYMLNDNVLQLTPPYLDNLVHGVTFTLSGVPNFALGPVVAVGNTIGNSKYVNINNYTYPLALGAGASESDNPVNDGDINVITSTFTLTQVQSAGSTLTCPAVSTPTMPSGLGSLFTSQLQWTFCYTFTGVNGLGTSDFQQWFITATGTLTTTAWPGTGAVSGRTGYLVTGLTGTRTFSDAGTGVNNAVPLVAVGSPNAQSNADAGTTGLFDYLYQVGFGTNMADNVFYPTYPYFDQYGINMLGNGYFGNEDFNNLTVNALRVWVNPSSWSFNEWESTYGVAAANEWEWLFSYGAAAVFTPYTSNGQSVYAQCSPTYGTLNTFQFCYWIDGTAQSPAFFDYVFGQFTATGPVYRNGRQAYTLQTMNGVRSMTTGGVTNSSGIVYLEWIGADFITVGTYALPDAWINDNLVYTTSPVIDQNGLIFATSNAPVFPNGVGTLPGGNLYYGFADINLYSSAVGNSTANLALYEYSVLNPTLSTYNSANAPFGFNYVQASGVPNSSLCAYTGSSTQYITPIATQTYSFCYLVQGADSGGWQTSTSGTFTVYTTPIWNNGLLAYAVQNMTGVRTYQDPNNVRTSVTITGVNGNTQGAFGWEYNNLYYAAAPYLDSFGMVYNFAGTANSIGGVIVGDGANTINLFVDTGYFQEEFYNSATYGIYGDKVGTFAAVQDNGASYAAGSVLSSQCGYSGAQFVNTQTTFGFCYAVQNTMATSPYLPWAVLVTGTLTVYSNSFSTGILEQTAEYPGYLVVSASANRTVWVQGLQAQSQQMTLAPVNSYDGNDNILQPANSGLAYVVGYHGISFNTSTPAITATGLVTLTGGAKLSNVNLNSWQYPAPSGSGLGITEADMPLNDGVTGTVSSVMTVNYNSATVPTCSVTIPAYSATAAAQYAASVTYNFCYYFTGFLSVNQAGTAWSGTNWSITTTGTLTTAGYVGTTANGLSARVVTGATGSRVLNLGNGTLLTTPIIAVGGFNAFQYASEGIAGAEFSSESYFGSNNILYLSWPYFDSYGLQLQGSGAFWEPNANGLNTGQSALKIFIDPNTYDMAEWVLDFGLNTYYVSEAGTLQISQSSSVSSTTSFNAQCSSSYGTPQQYQWCYWLDRSGGNGNNRYFVQAYGTLTATGPVVRQGRTAYTIQAMTGVRTFTNVSSGVSSTNPILSLEYENNDEQFGGYATGLTFWDTNDNVLYQGSPPLDTSGFIYTTYMTPNPPLLGTGGYAGYTSSNYADIQLQMNQTFNRPNFLGLFESSPSSLNTSNQPSTYSISGNYNFSYTPGGLSSSSPCTGTNSRYAYPSLTTWSFCYLITGTTNNNYSISSAGTLSTYGVNVTALMPSGYTAYQFPGVPAQIIGAISGWRSYVDGLGNNSYITITGLGANSYASTGWLYNQLLYFNQFYFDGFGLLYTFTGTAQSPSGAVSGDVTAPAINVFNGASGFQEEAWINTFATAYDFGTGSGTGSQGVFQAIPDGGASYTAGTVARSSCGFTGSIPAGFPGGAALSSGSSSSGLSGGAIAGIVIGVVVGVILLCLVLLAVVLMSRRGRSKDTAPPTGKYATTEESRTETSQVQMTGGPEATSDVA